MRLFEITAILLAVIFLKACVTSGGLALTKPVCTFKIWQGNPKENGITKDGLTPTIKASDPEFANYSCMTGEDFKNLLLCGGK
jgi:hypothetical protein